MLVLKPTVAAAAIGATCSAGDVADDSLVPILSMILPRVEAAMGVVTLARGTFIDTFRLASMDRRHREDNVSRLRLSNGYVDLQSIAHSDSEGTPLASSMIETVDDKLGIVTLGNWSRGLCQVRYTSGFAVEPLEESKPDGVQVFKDVPEWIKGLAVGFLVEWFRTMRLNQSNLSQTISYSGVEYALRRHIMSRTYSTYMRPRAGIIWSERYESYVA